MKEVMIRIDDSIATALAKDAQDRGITVPELLRGILGEYVVTHLRLLEKVSDMMKRSLEDLDDFFSNLDKKMLRLKARDGALKCKDCTMQLTEKDVDSGKCSACGAPIPGMLGESEESKE